jgi:EAL domain-containing protein (putative c-di-GMP-specific phosphodiesterase class I)
VSLEAKFELQQAILDDQLVLYYQPIIALEDRSVFAVEALVRWRHPTRGILPPSQFVPAIERAGLARELTLWVLREAILQSAVWRKDGEPLSVGVNLSSENLRDAQFRRFLDITLRAVGTAEQLIAEIPAATLTSPEQIESLELMRQKGIRVAIDDVVGPMDLTDVPADLVKIGRGLAGRVSIDPRARSDIAEVVREAKKQGRIVVAVGVEDRLALPMIAGMGCDAVQGFALAQPMSTAELSRWRRSQ